jgi:recombination protein RecR
MCDICKNDHRANGILCVVESVRDLMAIEDTEQFNGKYHVLGGLISPIDGIGPNDLNIDSLVRRVQQYEVKELIMALSPTIEGDTTVFYISKLLQNIDVEITSLARGVAFGGDLEYADEFTLGRSIHARLPYKVNL